MSRRDAIFCVSTCEKTPNERAMLERQIEAVDGQTDELVYELYGLTAGSLQENKDQMLI